MSILGWTHAMTVCRLRLIYPAGRAMLSKRFAKKLTETEANILIEILQDKTKKLKLAKPKKYDDLSERDSKMSTPLQLRKIEAIWWDICNIAESVQQIRSLRKFVKRQCKIDDIKFLSKREASKLIAVLEKIKKEKDLKAV